MFLVPRYMYCRKGEAGGGGGGIQATKSNKKKAGGHPNCQIRLPEEGGVLAKSNCLGES